MFVAKFSFVRNVKKCTSAAKQPSKHLPVQSYILKNANVRKRWEINNATPFSSVYFVGFKPLLVLWELLGQIFSSYCWISFGKNFGIHSFSNLPTDTAYAINSFDGQWHYFDDSSVSSADADSPVVSGFHHLFFPLLFSWHQCTEMQGFYRISILNPNKRRVP